MADNADLIAALQAGVPAAQSLEGAPQRAWPNGIWGPKTATEDLPHHLPESMIGELPYRYQGVALHSLLSMLPGLGPVLRLGNLGYAGMSALAGNTAPVARPEEQLPTPSYPVSGSERFSSPPLSPAPLLEREGRPTWDEYMSNRELLEQLGLTSNNFFDRLFMKDPVPLRYPTQPPPFPNSKKR